MSPGNVLLATKISLTVYLATSSHRSSGIGRFSWIDLFFINQIQVTLLCLHSMCSLRFATNS